jgi:acyl-CoA synthetase (AMP-forming)/AMP-acid ligase II
MDGVFDSEGYFRTGDLGKIENGNIYIFGRASQDGRSDCWRALLEQPPLTALIVFSNPF